MEAIVVELIGHSLVTSKIEPDSIELPHLVEAKGGSDPGPELDATASTTHGLDYNDLVLNLTEVVHSLGAKVSFSCDERSSTPIIMVMDDQTGEQIRQIPTEEALHLKAKLEEGPGRIFEWSI